MPVFYAKHASSKILAIAINRAKKGISRNGTCLRSEVNPKDARCKLGPHLVTAFVPKAAEMSTLLAEAILSVTPCGKRTPHLSPRTYVFGDVLEVQWQVAEDGDRWERGCVKSQIV